jgi:hypothetical protein
MLQCDSRTPYESKICMLTMARVFQDVPVTGALKAPAGQFDDGRNFGWASSRQIPEPGDQFRSRRGVEKLKISEMSDFESFRKRQELKR